MTGEELQSCPFCGGEAVYDKYHPYDGYQREGYTHIVYCRACHASIKGADEGVIAKWNGRVFISISDQAELARLENIALGSLIRKLEDIVRENEGILTVAKEDRDGEGSE